ncbi:hypothetical protein EYZ11_006728 [Aspergillus tanneri]|uniref:Cytochrome b5 heme-binding domain-containing protein n=1 Tax=Aspergillus tanneri TaxID=1220188 RepID=A0A4S3JF10_9EURO|nr:hypothetical protein EYZ11_006728 [Aspergillus tanneri]
MLDEGYYNFHHKSPSDHYSGIEWYQADVNEWISWLCSCVGLARNLKPFRLVSREAQMLVAVERLAHDFSDFVSEHPGGVTVIRTGLEKDAVALFNRGVYDYSRVARNLLATM